MHTVFFKRMALVVFSVILVVTTLIAVGPATATKGRSVTGLTTRPDADRMSAASCTDREILTTVKLVIDQYNEFAPDMAAERKKAKPDPKTLNVFFTTVMSLSSQAWDEFRNRKTNDDCYKVIHQLLEFLDKNLYAQGWVMAAFGGGTSDPEKLLANVEKMDKEEIQPLLEQLTQLIKDAKLD